MSRSSGGKSKVTLHLLSDDHATLTAAAELSLTAIVKTSRSGTGVSLDQIESTQTIADFINEYASAIPASGGGGGAEGETVILDDGSSEELTASSSGSATNQQFLLIHYGGTVGTTVKVSHYIGTISSDTGSHDSEANKFDRYTIALEGVNAKAAVVVTAASYDAAIVDAATTATVPEDKWAHISYEAEA